MTLPRWRLWLTFFAVAAIVAAPQILWIVRGSPIRAERFFEWAPGWSQRPEPIAWFWFKNTGLFIPLLVIALLAPARWVGSGLRRFFLPFLLTFIVPNLFRIAPRIWDNNKMLIVVGPAERGAYAVNDRFISQFPLVGAAGRHELRRIRGRPIAAR